MKIAAVASAETPMTCSEAVTGKTTTYTYDALYRLLDVSSTDPAEDR